MGRLSLPECDTRKLSLGYCRSPALNDHLPTTAHSYAEMQLTPERVIELLGGAA